MSARQHSKKRRNRDRLRRCRVEQRQDKFDTYFRCEMSMDVKVPWTDKTTTPPLNAMEYTWSYWAYDYRLKRHVRIDPDAWEPITDTTCVRKVYNKLMTNCGDEWKQMLRSEPLAIWCADTGECAYTAKRVDDWPTALPEPRTWEQEHAHLLRGYDHLYPPYNRTLRAYELETDKQLYPCE